jgi:hypothetical protein
VAQRVYQTQFTVPLGTLASAPASLALPPNEETIERLEIVVPKGHGGLTGLAIFYGPQQVIPYNVGTFIVADGVEIGWPMERLPTGKQWIAKGFNTGVFDHSFYIRLLVHDTPDPSRAPFVPVPLGSGVTLGPAEAGVLDQQGLSTEIATLGAELASSLSGEP